METGFLNFHDEEHFSICEQNSKFENGSSLFGGNDYVESFSLPWQQKFNVNVGQIKVEPNCNEDYEKTFNAWNQHLKELDRSIKCEGGIFLPGIDDPVCFSSESPSHQSDPIFPQSPFLRTGSNEEVVFSYCEDDGRASESSAAPNSSIKKTETDDQQKPVLEAGDLKTLLEQFEAASSKPQSPRKTHKKVKCTSVKTSSTIVHKSIKEALPKQVIDRIRESCKRRKEANMSKCEAPAPVVAQVKAVEKKQFPTDGVHSVNSHSLSSSPIERVGDRKLLRLEHNYCCRDGSDEVNKAVVKEEVDLMSEESRLPSTPPDYSTSRKDSGLESGELTDSSSIGSPQQICLSLPPTSIVSVKQEIDGESIDEANLKKKKKLKLEEYWERRKNMKPVEGNPPSPSVPVPVPLPVPASTPQPEVVIKTEPRTQPIAPTFNLSTYSQSEDPQSVSSTPTVDRQTRANAKDPTYIVPDDPLSTLNRSEDPQPTNVISVDHLPTGDPSPLVTASLTANDDSNCAATAHPPKTQGEKEGPKPAMVSVEVQTAELEPKESKNDKKLVDEELQKKKEMWLETMRSTYRPRYSSSSSNSSYDTKSYSRKRGKTSSRRYRRWRSDSSCSRSRSRSRSKSSSSSSSSSEFSSGKSRSKSRRKRRSFSRSRSRKYSVGRSTTSTRRTREDWSPLEKQRQVEERRVVYVGHIEDGISKQRLRDRFHKFGHIVDISLHFRERGDNYGFVTFKYPDDAYQAVEHGNDYGLEPKYDICFGGRRAFCKQRYSDLDCVGNNTQHYGSFPAPSIRQSCNSFDLLLREAQENLRKRSAV